MATVAVYDSYRVRHEQEFATIEATLDFLIYGSDEGELSPVEVRDDGASAKLFDDGSPSPGTVLKGEDLFQAQFRREGGEPWQPNA